MNYVRQALFPSLYDEDVPVEEYDNYVDDKEGDLPLRRTKLPIPKPYGSYKDVEGIDNYAVEAMKAIGFENWLVEDEAGVSIAVSNPANIRVKHAAFDPNKLHSPKMNESNERLDRINNVEEEYRLPNLASCLPPDYIHYIIKLGLPRVTIYRAVPAGVNEIRPGDWVALTKDYAKSHLREKDGTILSKRVPAEDVVWAGTDINEYFYIPKIHKMTESTETFDTDKIDVKEVYDPKWNIVRYTFTIPLSHGAEIEAYVVSDGDTLQFRDILTKNAKDHPLFHDNRSSSAAYSQTVSLGTAETRRLIRYIFSYVRERHPEIKNISSTRVTGARPASGKRSMDFALPIS